MTPPRADPGPYAACLALPCAVLGVRTGEGCITGLDFLPPDTPIQPARDALVRRLEAELEAYLRDPAHRFDLPTEAVGTPFRQRVWSALQAIPAGRTRTYGDLAHELGSSARAVGQAVGDNPLPIIVPCHRVLASHGLGGFAHQDAGYALEIKRWLLRHEGVRLDG